MDSRNGVRAYSYDLRQSVTFTPGIKVPTLVDFGNPGGGVDLKRNNSTSEASKVRSRWTGVDLKGGVELSNVPVTGDIR